MIDVQEAVLVVAIVACVLPLGAVFVRGRARPTLIMATAVSAAAMIAHLVIVHRLVQGGPRFAPDSWVYALVISGFAMMLAGVILAAAHGRAHPNEGIREMRRPLVVLGLTGVAALFFLRDAGFVSGYAWIEEKGTVHLGWMGKAYLSYLLLGMIGIGYNLEKTYRTAPPAGRTALRLPLTGFFLTLGYYIFVVAVGILYSSVGMGKLVFAGIPITIGGFLVAFGTLRGSIQDVDAPVSRSVVYSSFTALAAGLFVLAIGVAAQLATLTRWSPDVILIVASTILASLVALLLLFSNRFQRQVRRFVDRNFYVNRYDYRSQWSKLTHSLETANDRESVLDRAVRFLIEACAADELTISLLDEKSNVFAVARGRGLEERVRLEADTPVVRRLAADRKTLILNRKVHDFVYVPIYAENARWLDATASQMVAPLMEGDCLVGIVGMARKDRDDPFTFEDAALLDTVGAHIAGSLRSVRLAAELAEKREVEIMSQWSSMLLHDLKNYLAPLRLVATNLVEYRSNPETPLVCAEDIRRVTGRMEELVQTLSRFRTEGRINPAPVCVNGIVRDTVAAMKIEGSPGLDVSVRSGASIPAMADREMIRRVVENLIGNAVEAMKGGGRLDVETSDFGGNGTSRVRVSVADTGCGMSEEFVREKLFRPFSTTKKKGLGLGLYQCRLIVHAHGGELRVASEPGQGSRFEILLPAASTVDAAGAASVESQGANV